MTPGCALTWRRKSRFTSGQALHTKGGCYGDLPHRQHHHNCDHHQPSTPINQQSKSGAWDVLHKLPNLQPLLGPGIWNLISNHGHSQDSLKSVRLLNLNITEKRDIFFEWLVNCHDCPQIPAKKGGRENYKYYDVDGLGNMDRVSLHNHIVKHWKLRLFGASCRIGWV